MWAAMKGSGIIGLWLDRLFIHLKIPLILKSRMVKTLVRSECLDKGPCLHVPAAYCGSINAQDGKFLGSSAIFIVG